MIEGVLTHVDFFLSVRQWSSLGHFLTERCLYWAEISERDLNKIPLT